MNKYECCIYCPSRLDLTIFGAVIFKCGIVSKEAGVCKGIEFEPPEITLIELFDKTPSWCPLDKGDN